VDNETSLLEEKLVCYLLDAWFFLLWWNILGKVGLILLSLEIGKRFLHIVKCFFLFHGYSCLNPRRRIRVYILY
jgi:hypothetical protein